MELDALRRVTSREPSEDVLRAIDRQTRAVESARLEAMAFIATITNAKVRAIAVIFFRFSLASYLYKCILASASKAMGERTPK